MFNKISIQARAQMAADKEAVGLSRVHEYESKCNLPLGAIQVLRNAVGMGVSAFPEKSVTKVYGSTLLALWGGG